MTSGTFSYPSQRNTGYKVTAEDWNEFVDDLTYLGTANSISLNTLYTDGIRPSGLDEQEFLNKNYLRTEDGTPKLYFGPALQSVGISNNWMSANINIPVNYRSNPKLIFQYYGTATSGTLIVGANIGWWPSNGTIGGTQGALSYGTLSMAGTANHVKYGTISISDDAGVLPNSNAAIGFVRGSVSTCGTIYFYGFKFQYQS